MGNSNAKGELKHRPETVWRLVEAHCKQITDALAAARLPLVLGLTWSFVWAWSLYAAGLGYVHAHHKHSSRVLAMSESANPQTVAKFQALCLESHRRRLPDDVSRRALTTLSPKQTEQCVNALKKTQEWAGKQLEESLLVSFPFGLAKTTVADLGVIGQLGLILIMAWGYFSTRREYQAVNAMVELRIDPQHGSPLRRLLRKLGLEWTPRTYVLVPGERHLSAEHLAYAFHSVAQRFLFILTNEARPLPWASVALLCFPALVASVNLVTDLYDVYRLGEATAPEARWLTVVEALLLLGVTWPLTVAIMRLAARTAALLHGWNVAVSKVWMEQWDERNEDPAIPVYIDVTVTPPAARPVSNEEHDRCHLPQRPLWRTS
jgi:hypothetical protein